MMQMPTLFPEDEFPSHGLSRVYFGLSVALDQVKIGITRRKVGRRGGEMHFTELCSDPGGRADEDYYHGKYAKERIGSTEWFKLSDRLLVDLLTMCVGQGRTPSVEILKTILYKRLWDRRKQFPEAA